MPTFAEVQQMRKEFQDVCREMVTLEEDFSAKHPGELESYATLDYSDQQELPEYEAVRGFYEVYGPLRERYGDLYYDIRSWIDAAFPEFAFSDIRPPIPRGANKPIVFRIDDLDERRKQKESVEAEA